AAGLGGVVPLVMPDALDQKAHDDNSSLAVICGDWRSRHPDRWRRLGKEPRRHRETQTLRASVVQKSCIKGPGSALRRSAGQALCDLGHMPALEPRAFQLVLARPALALAAGDRGGAV